MVEALEDPYSNYVDAESFPFVDDRLSGEIFGIGVVIGEIEDTGEIEVVNVIDGTPAAAAGVEVGDIFMTVEEEEILGLSYLELAARVRGPEGTEVDITMRRGEDLIDFTIERARIEIPNVEYEVLEDNIGYLSMSSFTAIARQQVDEGLDALNVDDLSGLIFDLRGNPGGFLDTATEIGALFVEDGDLLIEEFGTGEERTFRVEDGVVYEVFSSGSERVYTENAAFANIEVPIVVLIDERSASASELVSGAWQDLGVATIIGETSFGKGTVQTQNTLVNGGGVRLTVARWLTPAGNWISEIGVTPDIVVEIAEDAELEAGEDPQLEAAVEYLREQQPVLEIE
jgi:carboxyl-terminal processing protease